MLMRRSALLLLLILSLPVAMWANSSNVVFQNSGGKIVVGAGNSLQLKNSTLTSFTGLNGLTSTGILGTVNFSTGTMMSGGSLANGMATGVLFSGSFVGPVSWVGTYDPAGRHGLGNWTYVLSGTVSGTLSNGAHATG